MIERARSGTGRYPIPSHCCDSLEDEEEETRGERGPSEERGYMVFVDVVHSK